MYFSTSGSDDTFFSHFFKLNAENSGAGGAGCSGGIVIKVSEKFNELLSAQSKVVIIL
jgi:hypothetical protein